MNNEKMTALRAVIEKNRAVLARARELNKRAGEKVFSVPSRKELEELFLERLSGATRAEEIVDFEALELSPLDEELVGMVYEDNPDTISLLGREAKVEYWWDSIPRVLLDFRGDQKRDWIDLPDTGIFLPGGREVEMYSAVEGYGYYIKCPSSQFKAKAVECLNQGIWDNWQRPEIPSPDPNDETAQLPPIQEAVYGQSVIDGAQLVAYGTISVSSYYNSFETKWFRDRAEAENQFNEAKAEFEKMKVTARERREAEVLKIKVKDFKEVLSSLLGKEEMQDVSWNLRNSASEMVSPYYHIPSDSNSLRGLVVKIEGKIAEIEAAIAEVIRQREEEEKNRLASEEWRHQQVASLRGALSSHYSTCPFCGKEVDWEGINDIAYAVDGEGFDLCYDCEKRYAVSLNLGRGWDPARKENEEEYYFVRAGRKGRVIRRTICGGETIAEYVAYYKYGNWSFRLVVYLETLVRGEWNTATLWREPSESELKLAELRRMRETYAQDEESAHYDVENGYSFVLTFRRGVNPKTNAEQYEAGSRKNTLFIANSHRGITIEEGRQYYCRQWRELVPGRVVIVEPYLEAGRDIEAEIAELEAQIRRYDESTPESEQTQSHSEQPAAPQADVDQLRALADKFKKR